MIQFQDVTEKYASHFQSFFDPLQHSRRSISEDSDAPQFEPSFGPPQRPVSVPLLFLGDIHKEEGSGGEGGGGKKKKRRGGMVGKVVSVLRVENMELWKRYYLSR